MLANGITSISTTPENSIALNSWQHVAATYNAEGGLVEIYINGIKQILTQTVIPSGSIRDNLNNKRALGVFEVLRKARLFSPF